MIEVLVVVFVIGILSGLGVRTVKKQIDKSRDARRKSDIYKLTVSFEDYFNDNICYPTNADWEDVSCGDNSTIFSPYLDSFPCDPTTKEKYTYQTIDQEGNYCDGVCGDCYGYRILSQLANKSDKDIVEIGCDPDEGCGVEVPDGKNPNWGIAMGGKVPAPGFNPRTTPSPAPTSTSIPTPIPTLITTENNYALDDTKFLATYVILTFHYPEFPTEHALVDVSFREDFGGTIAEHLYNPYLYYSPDDADTILNVAYTRDGNMGSLNPNNQALRSLTSKSTGYISQPYLWKSYLEGCGKTIYWRLKHFYDHSIVSSTYSNQIDCDTKVGVVSPPISWYTVYNQILGVQKQYDKSWDFDNNGVINWTDHAIGALSTKTRAGGWQPPE